MKMTSSKKVLAAFVLGFLCLNAAGALCLTYCSSLMMTAAVADDSHLSEHCKAMQAEAQAVDDATDKVAKAEAACCMMPVAMLAVPVEKRSTFQTVDVAVLPQTVVNPQVFEPVATITKPYDIPFYRPPPLDRRIERQLNCVIRI